LPLMDISSGVIRSDYAPKRLSAPSMLPIVW
jgi:hypothetical protein